MPAWLIKPALYALSLAAVVWLLHAGYSSIWQRGYDSKTTEVTIQQVKDERTQAIAALAREAEVRAIEVAQAAKQQEVAQAYEKDKANAQAAADRTIADLRSGAVRVQRRLQCPSVPAADVSSGAAGSAVDHGPAQAGLTDEDAGDLVRIARDGDEAIVQLGACQSAIRVMQGQ